MKNAIAKIKRFLPGFIVGLVFAVAAYLGIHAAMKPVSTSSYCGSNCHEMNTAYQTWELSPHGANRHGFRVECIDCHLPPEEEFFTHITAKALAGARDVYKHKFGPEYAIETLRQKVIAEIPSERCKHCHDDLLAKPGDSAAQIAHKAALAKPDEPENRCVHCHEDVGHERTNTLYTP